MRQQNLFEAQESCVPIRRLPNGQLKDIQKSDGVHFTPDALANFVTKNIIDNYDFLKKKKLRIIDPAIGDGALISPLIEAINKSSIFTEIFGFDISQESINSAKDRISATINEKNLYLEKRDFIEYFVNLSEKESNQFDLVISNPPYVRTQVLGADYSQQLAKFFGFSGRVDIYYAFIEGIAKILTPGGIAGIIVSNKFMKNKSGAEIRRRILESFDVLHIWDFGDTRLFEAAVLPCVLILRKKKLADNLTDNNSSHEARYTAIYSLQKDHDSETLKECSNPIEAVLNDGNIKVGNDLFQVQHGTLKYANTNSVWQLSTSENRNWLDIVSNNTWKTFKDVSKIKVGIKTTADSIFISDNWDNLKELPELLLPLTTHKIAGQFRPKDKIKTKVLYTHKKEGKKRCPIDIEQYPISKEYLLQNYDSLNSRKYIHDAKRKWYEIWVPHDPEVWSKAKIVFRDISKEPTFWLDDQGTVVNGDCYWILLNDKLDKSILWLMLAVGNSKFIEEFYDHRFNNKLYAGRRRFMTQYVENFPLPNPDLEESKNIIEISKKLYHTKNQTEFEILKESLNNEIYSVFGL